MSKTSAALEDMVRQLQAETAVAKARMLIRADEIDRVIAKHGDPGGHLALMTRLLPAPYTMHKLRHRFASRTYDVEKDLAAVQELLGHASPATTRVYIAVSRDRLRAMVNAAAA